MSQNAARIDRSGNDVQKAGPGDMVMDQKKRFIGTPMTLAGNQTIPAEAILAGIVVRTGPVAGYADIFPSADSLLAACTGFDVGDAFEFLFDNSATAFANTPTAGAGITLVNGGVTASLVKRFLITCLAGGRTQVLQAQTTTGNGIINFNVPGVSPSQANKNAQLLQPGMLVTGTGIGASAKVIGVNSVNGTAIVDVVSTGTAVVGVTFTPNVEVRGLYQAAA